VLEQARFQRIQVSGTEWMRCNQIKVYALTLDRDVHVCICWNVLHHLFMQRNWCTNLQSHMLVAWCYH
jgi:hypothetical protein